MLNIIVCVILILSMDTNLRTVFSPKYSSSSLIVQCRSQKRILVYLTPPLSCPIQIGT